MKVSEVTTTFAKDFCGVSVDDTSGTIEVCMAAAASFIRGYTGLDSSEIDAQEDITIAYLVLVNEMYTKRDYTVDMGSLNPAVKQILAMYSVNYL